MLTWPLFYSLLHFLLTCNYGGSHLLKKKSDMAPTNDLTEEKKMKPDLQLFPQLLRWTSWQRETTPTPTLTTKIPFCLSTSGGNKSNAHDLINWRWKPTKCQLPSFDPTTFLHTYRVGHPNGRNRCWVKDYLVLDFCGLLALKLLDWRRGQVSWGLFCHGVTNWRCYVIHLLGGFGLIVGGTLL